MDEGVDGTVGGEGEDFAAGTAGGVEVGWGAGNVAACGGDGFGVEEGDAVRRGDAVGGY